MLMADSYRTLLCIAPANAQPQQKEKTAPANPVPPRRAQSEPKQKAEPRQGSAERHEGAPKGTAQATE
jgi:hypothetical protein